MKGKLRAALLAIFSIVFVVSGVMLVYRTIQYQQGDDSYAQAEGLVDLPDFSSLPAPTPPTGSESTAAGGEDPTQPPVVYVDPYADALRNMDFTALREVNSDVLGWILIPNTKISYPIVQGTDNDYYLNRTWKKGRNSVGAIFLEHTNKSDFSDFNTIIYGHRMNNRSMFGSLAFYKDQSYWVEHPSIYITDARGSHKYEIFAAYEVSVEGETYRLGLSGVKGKQRFIDYCVAKSVIDTKIVPTTNDSIITLSTCTGNGHATRWVVQGVLRGDAPADVQPVPEQPQQTPPATEAPAVSAPQPMPEAPILPDIPVSQDIQQSGS